MTLFFLFGDTPHEDRIHCPNEEWVFPDRFAEAREYVPMFTETELEDGMLRLHRGLAERGWYLSFGQLTLDAIMNWGRHIDSAPHDLVEEHLVEYARSRVEEITWEASHVWLDRAQILGDALTAHRNAVYTLSIPAMLAQADGICQEILGAQMFKKERSNPKLPNAAAALDKALAKITVAGNQVRVGISEKMRLDSLRLLNRLSENISARDQRKARGKSVGPLNRHGVLHGVDIDYPNEANSLRCTLILDFLNDVRNTLDFMRETAAGWEALLRDPKGRLKARENAVGLV